MNTSRSQYYIVEFPVCHNSGSSPTRVGSEPSSCPTTIQAISWSDLRWRCCSTTLPRCCFPFAFDVQADMRPGAIGAQTVLNLIHRDRVAVHKPPQSSQTHTLHSREVLCASPWDVSSKTEHNLEIGHAMGDSHLFLDVSFQFEHSGGMPRQARVVIPGLPHHITQWGNNREDVFLAITGHSYRFLVF